MAYLHQQCLFVNANQRTLVWNSGSEASPERSSSFTRRLVSIVVQTSSEMAHRLTTRFYNLYNRFATDKENIVGIIESLIHFGTVKLT